MKVTVARSRSCGGHDSLPTEDAAGLARIRDGVDEGQLTFCLLGATSKDPG